MAIELVEIWEVHERRCVWDKDLHEEFTTSHIEKECSSEEKAIEYVEKSNESFSSPRTRYIVCSLRVTAR